MERDPTPLQAIMSNQNDPNLVSTYQKDLLELMGEL